MNSGILTQNNEEFYPITQANLVKTSDGVNIEETFAKKSQATLTSVISGMNLNDIDYSLIGCGSDVVNANTSHWSMFIVCKGSSTSVQAIQFQFDLADSKIYKRSKVNNSWESWVQFN